MIKKTIVLIMMFILLCIPTTHVMALENSTQYSYIEQVYLHHCSFVVSKLEVNL